MVIIKMDEVINYSLYFVRIFPDVESFKHYIQWGTGIPNIMEVKRKGDYCYYCFDKNVFYVVISKERLKDWSFEPKQVTKVTVRVYPVETRAMTVKEFVDFINGPEWHGDC